MRSYRWFLGGVTLWPLVLSFPALAQDIDYFSLPPDQLLAAEVISVSKQPERIADTAAAVFVITQSDIARSGVTTLPDALRMAPGVQVARADNNSWAISIRGFNGALTNKLLVMIDGRSVYNPLFAGTYWELQDYLLEDIERIEVVRGPGGAMWGANAVNGVINIITKRAESTQGNLVSGLYGTEEGAVNLRHGGSFGDDNHYRVYAKYFDMEPSRKIGGGNASDASDGGRGGFRADWGDVLTVQGDLYRIYGDQLNSTPNFVAPFTPIVSKETMESEGANILGRWKKDMDNGDLLTVQTYLDYTNREQILLKDERSIFDFDAQYNFADAGRHKITTGAGYRYTQDNLGNSPNVEFFPSSRSDNLFSFFAQDKIALSENEWYLTLGSKFEHNDYTGFEFQPNARLQYHPDSTQMFWGAVSKAVRTPSRLEHDLNNTTTIFTTGTAVVLMANRDFESEELIAYEAGYRKQVSDDFSFDIAAFYNDYDNMATVGFLPTSPGLFPIEAVNGMTAETYGFEIASTWNVTDDVQLSASYSFLDMFLHVEENGGFDLETAERLSPHHQANMNASWKISQDVSLDGFAYYVDELSQSNVDDYVRFDVNLGWQITDNMKFNLVGQNLMDDSHREFSSPTSLNATEVQRGVFGKLTCKF